MEVDAWFNRCKSLAGTAISCDSGCSQCCRGLFDITLLDACFLKSGFDILPMSVRMVVLEKCKSRLAGIRSLWPEFSYPYILNCRSDEEWETIMPQQDETPCVLLGDDGRCLVYAHRPMTCRLHGVPLVDQSGEVMDEDWCSLNFTGYNPLQMSELSGDFINIFRSELTLFQLLTNHYMKHKLNELDTLIPAALLIDFSGSDLEQWYLQHSSN